MSEGPGYEVGPRVGIWGHLEVVGALAWEDPLGKEMATCSSTLAWKCPWTEEPGGLQFMGSLRVGHD